MKKKQKEKFYPTVGGHPLLIPRFLFSLVRTTDHPRQPPVVRDHRVPFGGDTKGLISLFFMKNFSSLARMCFP